MSDQQGGFGRMLVTMPLLMLVSRMDFSNENLLMAVRLAYFLTLAAQAGVHYLILQRIKEKRGSDTRKIWVKGTAPGQSQIVETTYAAHESAMAKQAIQQALMGGAIMTLLHFKMGLHAPLVLQVVMVPYNLWTSNLFKIYIMGEEIEKPWKESFEPPSPAEQAASGAGAGAQSEVDSQKAFRDALVHAWDNPGEEQTLDDAVALLRSEAVAVDHQLPEEDGRWTILMVAAGHKRVPPEVLGNLLSAYSPDLFAQDADGWTALHWACFHNRRDAVTRILLAALDSDADADAEETEGRSVDVAQLHRLSPRVRALLAVTDGGEQTPVDLAVAEGSAEALTALEEAGVPLPDGALAAAAAAAAAAAVTDDNAGDVGPAGLSRRDNADGAQDISEVD